MLFLLTMPLLTRRKYIVKDQKFWKVKMQRGRRKYSKFDKEMVWKNDKELMCNFRFSTASI